MSAIVASVATRLGAPARPELCEAMLAAMLHRGQLVERSEREGVALAVRGHRAVALARMDELTVVMDGNIHNREDLHEADIDGMMSAADVALRCYRRWGEQALPKLIGDFAFVLHDGRARKVIVARDAIGMRPLYFRRHGGCVLFATEAQALTATGLPSSRPNSRAIALFIVGQYRDEGATLRDDVEALPPAHAMHIDERGVRVERYWKPDPWRRLAVGREEAERLFTETFRKAVRARLPSDGQAGVMLSGGLDSASIACQTSAMLAEDRGGLDQLNGHAPLALHVRLGAWDCDETAFSSAVTNKWRMPSLEIDGDGNEMLAACRPSMRHPDAIYHAAMACFDALFDEGARRGLSTVFTGLGGDEWLDETGGECVDALREGKLSEVAAITGIERKPWSLDGYRILWERGVKRLVPEAIRSATRRIRHPPSFPFMTPRYAQDVFDVLHQRRRQRHEERYPDETSADLCDRLGQFGVRVGSPQVSLRGATRGLDVAHPFMDRRVVELSLAVPRAMKLRRGYLKHKPLLRHSMASILPQAVSQRRDAAEFSCYLRSVYLRYHRKEFADLFEDSRLAQLGVIDGRSVRTALNAGLPNSIFAFGLITSMELWLRQSWP